MKEIKIGFGRSGFLDVSKYPNGVAYMYFKSETIFFRASGIIGLYWFRMVEQDFDAFTIAIAHESIHLWILRHFGDNKRGRAISRGFDKVLGDVKDLRI